MTPSDRERARKLKRKIYEGIPMASLEGLIEAEFDFIRAEQVEKSAKIAEAVHIGDDCREKFPCKACQIALEIRNQSKEGA